MSADAVAILGFVSLFALMLLRVPVGMAMGLVGVSGYAYLTGGGPALKLIGQTSMRTVTDYQFGVIPMFLLMGAFVSNSGVSRELFRAANTVVATGVADWGSPPCSPAVALPPSRARQSPPPHLLDRGLSRDAPLRLPKSFATGVIAAGGTLGAMLPPSTVLDVYGLITQQDIGKLFRAGIGAGPVGHADVHGDHRRDLRVKPDFLPTVPKVTWAERVAGLRDVWAPILLFVLVIGGLYGASSRRPRPVGWGRAAPSCWASCAAVSTRHRGSAPRCCRPRAPRRRSSPC